MKRLIKAAPYVFAIALLIGIPVFIIWSVRSFFLYISVIPKELGAALIAGVATVLVATLTVMVGRHFERKKELDSLYREKKTEIYDKFLSRFFSLTDGSTDAAQNEDADLVAFLREFSRALILWSGPSVINAFLDWKEHLAKGVPDAQTLFLTENLLRAIRDDLRHRNSGLKKGFFARIYLRESGLFMAASQKNPNITLAELASLEALLNQQSSDG